MGLVTLSLAAGCTQWQVTCALLLVPPNGGCLALLQGAVRLLQAVLETWTDVTRFPLPQRPDAAVLVGATDDLYVSR